MRARLQHHHVGSAFDPPPPPLSFRRTLRWGETFKASALSPAVKGKLGVAAPPGSTEVFDRVSRQLVPCTVNTCSEWYTYPNGTVQPLNRAPFSWLGGWVMNPRDVCGTRTPTAPCSRSTGLARWVGHEP